VTESPNDTTGRRAVHFPSLFELGRFALFCGVTLFAAWVAGTGRVAYTMIMLVIAAALAFAVVDLVDYEIVKRRKRD
jgi:MFS-type transporter involved in bile tolerance (Atg22 family)